jgi:lipopolysaccharide transport system ATP-binding protein
MRFIRKMREERCLLFVSHDSEAVRSLCSQAIWLSKGQAISIGECKKVVLEYLRFCQATAYGEEVQVYALDKNSSDKANDAPTAEDYTQNGRDHSPECMDYSAEYQWTDNLGEANGWRTGDADLVEVKIEKKGDKTTSSIFSGGEQIKIIVRAIANKTIKKPILGFIVKDRLGQDLFGENTLFAKHPSEIQKANPGDELIASFGLRMPSLPSGEYTLMASIAEGDIDDNVQHHWVEDALILKVLSSRVRYGLAGACIHTIDYQAVAREMQ